MAAVSANINSISLVILLVLLAYIVDLSLFYFSYF